MRPDFFDRLDVELAALAREGAHLTAGDHPPQRALRLVRRAAVFVLLAIALAASLVSEFPASASGHIQVTRALSAERL